MSSVGHLQEAINPHAELPQSEVNFIGTRLYLDKLAKVAVVLEYRRRRYDRTDRTHSTCQMQLGHNLFFSGHDTSSDAANSSGLSQ